MSSLVFAQSSDTLPEDDYSKNAESKMLIQPYSEDTSSVVSEKQPSSIWLFIRMILVLAIVIACIYGVVFFIKKSMKTTDFSDDPYLKVVSTISLAPGKFIYIVTLNSVGYILGVTDNSINLIGQVEDSDLINAMNLNAEKRESTQKSKNFETILSYFNINKNEKTNSFRDSSNQTIETLRQHRERLNTDEENESEENV